MSETVAVVGAGSWGTTLARMLAENGQSVLLWARRAELSDHINDTRHNEQYLPGYALPPRVTATSDLQRVCEQTRLMLMAVPSHGFRPIAAQMGRFVDGEHVIVHCTKGVEPDSCKRMSEILREETPARRVGVLAGPNLSVELAKHQPAGTLVASRYDEVQRRVQSVLQTDYYRIYGGKDVTGVEIGSAFKNIVALAAGVVDGLAMGDNTKAMLMTRGLNEMVRVGTDMGAEAATFGGLAALGDLVATCVSQFSRNRRVGTRLAAGESLDQILGGMHMVAEGINAAGAVRAYGQRRGLRLPLIEAMHRLLREGQSPADAMSELMMMTINGASSVLLL